MKKMFYFLLFIFSFSSLFACPQYKVIDLGTLDTMSSMAASINDKGEVCGTYSQYQQPDKLFIWSQCTGTIYIPASAYSQFHNFAKGITHPCLFINNNGQIAFLGSAPHLALCVWDPKSGVTAIEGQDDHRTIHIHDFNDLGEIVYDKAGSSYVHKFKGSRQNLGKLFEAAYRIQINDKSELFGTAMSTNGYLMARFHSLADKRTYDINKTLKSNYYGISINNLSQGLIYWSSPNNTGSFIWSPSCADNPLGNATLPRKINDKGQIINGTQLFDGCKWININSVLNLACDPSTPFEYISALYDINNKGQMVGIGMIQGKSHAVLISPI